MLESIISPGTAERNPWDMLILGFAVSTVSIWIAFYLSKIIMAPASMLALAATVIALAPLIYRVLLIEEEKEEMARHMSPVGFITRHLDVVSVYSFLFIGLLLSSVFWYVALPHESSIFPTSDAVFAVQESTIPTIRAQITGSVADTLSGQGQQRYFENLFENNMRVMWLCFLGSVLFGAGALWLITWNASVIGVFIGVKIQADLMAGLGLPLGMSLWAIPEVLAYLVAAIAGGIVSVAVSRHHFKSERFWTTIFDSMLFMLIAIFLVFVGAYIEHFFVAA